MVKMTKTFLGTKIIQEMKYACHELKAPCERKEAIKLKTNLTWRWWWHQKSRFCIITEFF